MVLLLVDPPADETADEAPLAGEETNVEAADAAKADGVEEATEEARFSAGAGGEEGEEGLPPHSPEHHLVIRCFDLTLGGA